jgi:hypothetical protein
LGRGEWDVNDTFLLNANESVDTDGDGVGNNADPDGDSVMNDVNDACSLTSGSGSDADGNGCADTITARTSLIQCFYLPNGTQTSLLAKVNSAIAKLNAGDKAGAISTLQALINETRYQRGKKIPATQADILIAFTQSIIAGLP